MKSAFIREANENMHYETGQIVQIGSYENQSVPTQYGLIESIEMRMEGNNKPYIKYYILGYWRPHESIKAVMVKSK